MDKFEEIWECYDIKRKHVYRGKKCIMCESVDRNYYGIVTVSYKEGRVQREYFAKQYLQSHGFARVDQIVKNTNDALLSQDRYHTNYMVKHFFDGKELDVTSLQEVKEGAKQLALLHMASKGMRDWLYKQEYERWKQRRENWEQQWAQMENELDDEKQERMKKQLENNRISESFHENVDSPEETKSGKQWLKTEFQKKNVELKRIAEYMKKSAKTSAFVDAYNQCAPMFLQEGKETLQLVDQLYEKWKNECTGIAYGFVHGNYQHHNIMKDAQGWAVIGLEHFRFGPQIIDLYDYLRKVIEKNGYEYEFATAIISGYSQERRLEKEEMICLYLLLLYPDKFWKISNHYFNAKKTWVAPKMIEKLGNVVTQNRQKQDFLVKFREDYLDCGL